MKKKQVTELILGKIMTVEEYSHIEHETPYLFQLKAKDKELYYFGSSHVSDPSSPLFIEIENAFNKANPDIVFIEGMNLMGDKGRFNKKMKADTREAIIERMGEPGFTLKLALGKGIEWHSPEPTSEELYSEIIARGFSLEQLFAFEVFHILPQYLRQMKREGFESYVQRYIDRFIQATNWGNFDYSYKNAIRLGEQILGKNVDVENDLGALDYVDPIPWEDKKEKQTVLNRISETSSLIRDKKIVSDIAEALKIYQRIFIVYGSSHAVMQQPALKELFMSLNIGQSLRF